MAEGRILGILVQYRDRGLVQDRHTGLIDIARRASRLAGLRRRPGKIRQLGTTRLITREIVAGKKDACQRRMVRIDARIDVSDDSVPRNSKLFLSAPDA